MAGVSEMEKILLRIEEFVRNIAEKEGYKNFELKTTPMSTEGANYMADLFYVDIIENGKKTLNLFVKVPNSPASMRAVMSISDIYQKEALVYTTVADAYDKLQEKKGVPEEKRFKFPKYYGANFVDMEELLVLENLAAQGYILYDRFKPIDWEYAKAAVGEIAKFHALSFALEREDPEAFQEIRRELPQISRAEELMSKLGPEMATMGLGQVMSIVEPENLDRLEKFINEKIKNNPQQLMAGFFKANPKYSTIIHTDYRASNVLVKYQGNKIVSLKPVDYQGVFYGSPIYDILSFLFLGSDEDFRKKHFEDYLEHYHNSLAAHLQRLSLDINQIYPKSAFYFNLKDKMPFSLVATLMMLNIVLIDSKGEVTMEDFIKQDQPGNQIKPGVLYAERLNGIIKDFVRWGFL